MNKYRKVIFLIISICIIFSVFVLVVYNKKQENITVFVTNGDSPVKIAAKLYDAKAIKSKRLFLFFVQLFGYSKDLKAGVYVIGSNDNFLKTLFRIKNGSSINIKITIPEGFDIKKTGELLEQKGIGKSSKFIELAKEKDMEGFLLPETYFVDPLADEATVIKIMNEQFNRFFTDEMKERARQLNMSVKEIITLASIVEKEAVSDTERPVIAGIFYNRLRKKMRLEACSTVLYAMGINKERLTFEDLRFDSPYNTYRHGGLPPGPICNPGREAITAALYPAQTDSLFFVSRGNGTHSFSSTFEGHVKNKKVNRKNTEKAKK